MGRKQHTPASGPPTSASLKHLLHRLGRERRAMGEALLREHQVGACGHRTTIDGYCWYCQKRTGRPPALARKDYPNWPDE